jgi:hypothetical protein
VMPDTVATNTPAPAPTPALALGRRLDMRAQQRAKATEERAAQRRKSSVQALTLDMLYARYGDDCSGDDLEEVETKTVTKAETKRVAKGGTRGAERAAERAATTAAPHPIVPALRRTVHAAHGHSQKSKRVELGRLKLADAPPYVVGGRSPSRGPSLDGTAHGGAKIVRKEVREIVPQPPSPNQFEKKKKFAAFLSGFEKKGSAHLARAGARTEVLAGV